MKKFQSEWDSIIEAFSIYDKVSDGEADAKRTDFERADIESVNARNTYLKLCEKYAIAMYGLRIGSKVLYGMDERLFEVSHFTINCINSHYGELEVNGYEIDNNECRTEQAFFRIDLIPWKFM